MSHDPKTDLHDQLKTARDVLLWKLDGLSEYDVRRPLTPTGTNLLGLVKHLALVEYGYFGDTFGRPPSESRTWFDVSEPNADMWATPDESREDIVTLYRRAQAHADATINALPLDAVGRVPWWPQEQNEVTLHFLLAYVLAETSRHAGHADMVRELIDGQAGWLPGDESIPEGDASWWQGYVDRLERAAREAGRPAD
jgi:hypothetical protein